MKRRGNRRYYQHHEVLLIRRIRDLLYDQGFTISGARNRLAEAAAARVEQDEADEALGGPESIDAAVLPAAWAQADADADAAVLPAIGPAGLRAELMSIRELLTA
jgi:DNA-binding transcriptional MerR regulator